MQIISGKALRAEIDKYLKKAGGNLHSLAQAAGVPYGWMQDLYRRNTEKVNPQRAQAVYKAMDIYETTANLNPELLNIVVVKFFEFLDDSPHVKKNLTPQEAGLIISGIYSQACEESMETGRPAEITKVDFRKELRLIHGGKH